MSFNDAVSFGILITVEFKGDYIGMNMVGERYAQSKILQQFLQNARLQLRPGSIFSYCCTQKKHQGPHRRHRLLVHGGVDHLPLHEIIHRHQEGTVTRRLCQFTRIQPACCTGTLDISSYSATSKYLRSSRSADKSSRTRFLSGSCSAFAWPGPRSCWNSGIPHTVSGAVPLVHPSFCCEGQLEVFSSVLQRTPLWRCSTPSIISRYPQTARKIFYVGLMSAISFCSGRWLAFGTMSRLFRRPFHMGPVPQ
jgi:hypothetical protein